MEAPRGLWIIPNWITEEDEREIVKFLCKGEWSDHMSKTRPTQHFGYKYTLSGYANSHDKVAGDWGPLQKIANRLEKEFFEWNIQIAQALANMYYKDSTIGAHRDKEAPLIFGISLVNDINMDWTLVDNPKVKRRYLIPRLSLYIMSGESATEWMHSVPKLSQIYYGNRIVKKPNNYVRVSITFRHFYDIETRLKNDENDKKVTTIGAFDDK